MKNPAEVQVIGAGGHAKVVVSTLLAAGIKVAALFDDNPTVRGTRILGVEIVGPCAEIVHARPLPAVIAIGNNRRREELSRTLPLTWATVIHPRAWIDPSAKIGEGTVVFAGAIVQPCSVVGRHVIINTAATVDHDCKIGDFAQLACGVHLSGEVTVGTGAFLGTGSSTIQRINVGRWATLGAGAVLVRDLPDSVVAVGVPARPRANRRD